MVAFDNTILSILLFPDAYVNQGSDGKPVERAHDLVNALVQEIANGGEQVLIPTPGLAEVLATPDCEMDEVLSALRASAYIRVGDFHQRAAVELALRVRAPTASGNIREGVATTKTRTSLTVRSSRSRSRMAPAFSTPTTTALRNSVSDPASRSCEHPTCPCLRCSRTCSRASRPSSRPNEERRQPRCAAAQSVPGRELLDPVLPIARTRSCSMRRQVPSPSRPAGKKAADAVVLPADYLRAAWPRGDSGYARRTLTTPATNLTPHPSLRPPATLS